MVITSAQLTAFVGSLLWPLFRIGALMLSAPVFGARTVPRRVRAGLSVLVALAIAPVLPAPPAVDVFSAAAVLIIAQQILIGVMMGFAMQIVMSAVITGGQLIAMQMGLGFAAMVDPQNGAQTPVLSQFYVVMAVLIFLSLNGHLVLLEVLRDSFTTMPIGGETMPLDGIWKLIHWSGQISGNCLTADCEFRIWHHDSRRTTVEYFCHRLPDHADARFWCRVGNPAQCRTAFHQSV
jgi:flagellar biosynthetic protein FliR